MVGPSGGTGKVEGSAGRNNVEYGGVILVPGISIDEFVYEYGNPVPDVIKMDIEGGEVLALPGMKRVIAQNKPVILLELHGPEASSAAWELLRIFGYHIRQMKAGYPPINREDELDWKLYLVAVP